LDPLSFVYYLGYRYSKYSGLKRRKKLPHKMISIGNITTGGTGKTPATIAVAEEAKRRGFVPIVLTRGYKGVAKGPCFVTKGDGPLLSEADAGDEPVLMAGRLKGIPIVKGSNRYESGIFAINELRNQKTSANSVEWSEFSSNKTEAMNNAPLSDYQPSSPILFILDDGFQHWGLHRDKDIVLIDSQNPFGNRMLLPLGRLREPLSSLARADVIVLTKPGRTERIESPYKSSHPPFSKGGQGGATDRQEPKINNIVQEIRQYNSKSPIYFAEHAPVYCRLQSGERKPLSWVSGRKSFGFCALGSPESFQRTLKSIGVEIVGFKTFRDHYRYRQTDMQRIQDEAERCGAEWIVTTEKDIIKTRNLNMPGNILIIEIEFSVGVDFYNEVFNL
jgi:tetraacyldisaccharide 4'-kinase